MPVLGAGEVPAPSFAELNRVAARLPNHDEQYLVRSEYSAPRLREMTWDEFERECLHLWGENWRSIFAEVANKHERTLRRWWSDDIVKGSAITAMILAFRRLKAAGMSYPGSIGGTD
ncbi:MAG TPA: hypothetical protein VMV33_17235 [Rhodocyclaceae bacterium]|nr:hypothetical protein [Rhodocyclaceae bacterium]